MSYYYVFLNASAEFDNETIFHYQPPSIKNIGLVFDWWPPDDLFQCASQIFCTERLKYLLETDFQKFTGISGFEAVNRVTTGANWKERHPNARPDYYWQLNIQGQALFDDFGYFITNMKWLVVSERAVKFLAHNHVTEALGKKIEGDIIDFFEKYETHLKQSNYSELPPKLIDLDRFF